MFKSLAKFAMVLFKTKDLLEPDRWYKVEFWICKKDSKGGYVDTFKITSGVETHFEEPNTQYIGKQ